MFTDAEHEFQRDASGFNGEKVFRSVAKYFIFEIVKQWASFKLEKD